MMLKNRCSALMKSPASTQLLFSFLVAILYADDWRLAMLTSIGVGLAVVFQPVDLLFHIHHENHQ